jgi:ABC-2 type transport system ATP-binding protein
MSVTFLTIFLYVSAVAAIETQSLTKQYGSLHAVNDLDLRVERGEVFGFLGPNGAGKSTTINVLLDFVRRTSGEVRVLGHDPEQNPQAVRTHTGVLPETAGFHNRDTARRHLRFAIAMRDADDDPDALLERVGIADAADRSVGGFSTGMRQRLGLALALVGAPDLLILDEPLRGLDPDGARRLREIVREERDRGAAVFFSSHIMSQVETLCDRVGIMHDGRLVAADTVDALRAQSGGSAELVCTVAASTDDVETALAQVDGVGTVTGGNDTVRVVCERPATKAAVVARLEGAGITVQDLAVEGASLESVFAALTNDAASQERAGGSPVESTSNR